MKRLVISLAIACLISTQALAGDIPTSDAIPPPPSTQSASGAAINTNDDSATKVDESTTSQELIDTFVVSIVSLLMR